MLLMFFTACRKGWRLSRGEGFVKKWIHNLVTSTSASPFRSDDGFIVQIPTCDPLTPNGTTTTYVSRSPKTLKIAIESAMTGLSIQLYRARGRLRGFPLFLRRWFSRVHIPMRQTGALFWRISTWPIPEFPSLLGDWYVTVESARCEDGRSIH